MDIEMKIQPSFLDHECAIVFSFNFSTADKKIGEAVVYTHNEQLLQTKTNKKVAYIKELSIYEEYTESALNQIHYFLHVIGIRTCIHEERKNYEIV